MQIEMMSDAIDETLDKDEAEEETEELTNQVKYRIFVFVFCLWVDLMPWNFTLAFFWQVLDEIGVDIASQVGFSEIYHLK